MVTKLTLSIPPRTVRKGKSYAAKHDTSLSKLVAQFLDGLDQPGKTKTEMEPGIARMFGAYKLPTDMDVNDIRLNGLLEKHLGKGSR